MPESCVIGNTFVLGSTGRTFAGPVVISDRDAIVMIVTGDSARHQLNNSMRGPARLMSVMDGLVQSIPIPGLNQFEVTIDQLPHTIDTDHFPIPLEGERAFVFPRKSIAWVRCGFLSGVTFKADSIRAVVYGSGKQRVDAAEFFQRHHWPLDTRSFFQRLLRKAG